MSDTDPIYHQLVVEAEAATAIWLVDDNWHPVQKAIGKLDTQVLRGRYFVEFWTAHVNGPAYPIELVSDLHLTRDELETGPFCPRQAPIFTDE
jgi:hypothetical protein